MHAFARLIESLSNLQQASALDQRSAICSVLGWVCRSAMVDLAILFQRGEAGFSATHHARADDAQADNWAGFTLSHDVVARLQADWPVCLRQADDLPKIAPELAPLQRSMGSLVIAPVRQGGQLECFVCFGIADTDQVISDDRMKLLLSVADLTGSALVRHAAELQGAEATNRLDATLVALTALLFEVDADGCYTGFVAGPDHLMAAPVASLIGKPMDAVLPPDVAAIAMAALREVLDTGSTKDIRYRLDLADGLHVFELSGGLKAAADPQGRRSAIFLVRDVTEDVKLHDDLLRLGKIVEAMDNLVIIVDVDERVTWVNPAFESHSGWRLDEISGKRLASLVRCAESDPAVVLQVQTAIDQQRPFKGEMLNQDRHGNKYWVDFNILPLFDASGHLQGYVSVETVITPLKEQEAALADLAAKTAAAQLQLENALEALPDSVFLLDADERLIIANSAYRRTFPDLAKIAVQGVSLSDLLRAGFRKGIFSTISDNDDPENWLNDRLAAYRRPKFVEEIQLPDGRWLRRISIRTSDGGLVAVEVDITARRNHVAALDAVNSDLVSALEDRNVAKQRVDEIIDGAGIGTWELDILHDVLQVGGRWGEIVGLETKSLSGLSNADYRALVHPDDLKRLDDSRPAEFDPRRQTMEQEFRMWHRDGRWVWVLSRGRVTKRAGDGSPVVIAGIHVDISEIKQLEYDLLASQAYLSQVMDTNVSAVAVLSAEGVITFANSEAEHILGLERSQILGREYGDPAWRLERVTGGPLPDEDLPFKQAMTVGAPVRDIQFALHWPDGMRRVLSCNVAPLPLGNDQAQVVASFSDITEQLAATAKLEDALSRAEEMSRTKSIFLANMSHEIRTPLNGVLGMAEVLASQVTDPAKRRMIETIRKSGDTLLNVLNGILDMSKIEAGKMVLEEVPFSPLEILLQLEAIYGLQAEEKGLEFEVLSSPGCDKPRLGDSNRIHQILNNLLNNAMKFTERGKVGLKLSCRPGKPVVIEVSDSGIGMDEPQLEHAFESFTQGDDSTTRRYGGTGLGLSIVKQLVTLMSGEIELQSKIGCATKIRIVLPLPEADEPEAVAAAAANMPPQLMSLQGIRLLCADDNSVNLLVLKEMLSVTGAIITAVGNGQQVVDEWVSGLDRGEPFGVLLLDIAMPVRDGLSALSEIRATEQAKGQSRVPAIAVTANAMPHQIVDYVVGGFDAHLAKPFKQADLMHAIHSVLVARA